MWCFVLSDVQLNKNVKPLFLLMWGCQLLVLYFFWLAQCYVLDRLSTSLCWLVKVVHKLRWSGSVIPFSHSSSQHACTRYSLKDNRLWFFVSWDQKPASSSSPFWLFQPLVSQLLVFLKPGRLCHSSVPMATKCSVWILVCDTGWDKIQCPGGRLLWRCRFIDLLTGFTKMVYILHVYFLLGAQSTW